MFGKIKPSISVISINPDFPKDDLFDASSFVIDKLYNLPKVFIHKSKNEIKIISEFGNDISMYFDCEIFRELQTEPNNYIVECNISYMFGKLPSSQNNIVQDILNKPHIDSLSNTQIVFNVTDLLYFNEDISNFPLSRRKELLNTLKFGHHFKLSPFIIVHSKEDALKGGRILSKLLWSSGAVIRKASSKYIEGINNSQIEFLLK
jgi:ATP-dependent DNA ligase